jgi:hypothetical protein
MGRTRTSNKRESLRLRGEKRNGGHLFPLIVPHTGTNIGRCRSGDERRAKPSPTLPRNLGRLKLRPQASLMTPPRPSERNIRVRLAV